VIGVFIGRLLSLLFGVAAAIVIGIALHGCAQAQQLPCGNFIYLSDDWFGRERAASRWRF